MALLTKSKFYFGVSVDPENNVLDIDEGTGSFPVTLAVKAYAPSEIATALSSALNQAGTLNYSVTLNRTTRLLRITASGAFSIRRATGPNSASNIYSVLGFPGGTDLTGLSQYEGTAGVGFEFEPQFYLLDYVPLEHNVKSVKASINETGSGAVEVIRFGTKRYMECSIDFISDQKFIGDEIWESNVNGVSDALNFMGFAIEKATMEFMPNRLDVANYTKLVLESTESDSQGVGFRLIEMLDYGAGIYRTGRLVFREIS
jgi:hypothetical protein